MDYRQIIEAMTPDVYQRLKTAVELGRWPDGRRLTTEQREQSLQAVIAWGERHLPATQRVGYVEKGHKEGEVCAEPVPEPLNWKD